MSWTSLRVQQFVLGLHGPPRGLAPVCGASRRRAPSRRAAGTIRLMYVSEGPLALEDVADQLGPPLVGPRTRSCSQDAVQPCPCRLLTMRRLRHSDMSRSSRSHASTLSRFASVLHEAALLRGRVQLLVVLDVKYVTELRLHHHERGLQERERFGDGEDVLLPLLLRDLRSTLDQPAELLERVDCLREHVATLVPCRTQASPIVRLASRIVVSA